MLVNSDILLGKRNKPYAYNTSEHGSHIET